MNIDIDGLKINYTDEGSGSVIIMLHGWGSNIELFSGIISFASHKYRTIAMDMPGFGKSGEPDYSYSLDDFVSFVIKFIGKVCPEEKDIILLGHSLGGRIIIKLTAGIQSGKLKTDFNVTKVILTDSAGIMPVRTQKQNARTKRYHFYKKVVTMPVVKTVFPNALGWIQSKFGSADYSAASPVMRVSLVKIVNEDLEPYMKDVTMPALLIWGDQDTATPLSDGQRMEKLMPEAGLAVIQGASHYSFLDQPYLYNRILGSFLGIEA